MMLPASVPLLHTIHEWLIASDTETRLNILRCIVEITLTVLEKSRKR